MRTLLALALAATLLSPVAASAQALEAPVQSKLNLTLQDRYTIKELIKDIRVTPVPGKQDVSIGNAVPSNIKLEPMPAEVAAKVAKSSRTYSSWRTTRSCWLRPRIARSST